MSVGLVLALLTAFLATLGLTFVGRMIARSSGLLRVNHAGEQIPTSIGFALAPGCFVGLAVYSLLLSPEGAPASEVLIKGMPVLLLAVGWSVLGLLDDRSADSASKGFRGHLGALMSGQITTGFIKLLGGGMMSLVFAFWAAGASGRPVIVILLDALVLALFSNMINLFDLRPGRALKIFTLMMLAGIGLSAYRLQSGVDLGHMLLWLACGLALLHGDLRERFMIGDAGSNVLGAVLGALLVITQPHPAAMVLALLLLVGLHIYAEKHSISGFIERHPLLKAADSAGRPRPERIS